MSKISEKNLTKIPNKTIIHALEELILFKNHKSFHSEVYFCYGQEDLILGFFTLISWVNGGKIIDTQEFDIFLNNHPGNNPQDVSLFPEEIVPQMCLLGKDYSFKDLSRYLENWPKNIPLFLGNSYLNKYTELKNHGYFLSFYDVSEKISQEVLLYGSQHWPLSWTWDPLILKLLGKKTLDGTWLNALRTLEVYTSEPITQSLLEDLFPPSFHEEADIFFQEDLLKFSWFLPRDPLGILKLWQLWVWQLTQYGVLYYAQCQNQNTSDGENFFPKESILPLIEPKVFFKNRRDISHYGKKWTLDNLHYLGSQLLDIEENIKINKEDSVLLLRKFLLDKHQYFCTS